MSTTVLPISVSTAPSSEVLPETRGYFLSHSKAFSPLTIRQEIELAARAGFNLILFPAYINGYTLFPSETARLNGVAAINPLFKKWDPLAEATEVAHSFGLSLWGFARLYNFHPRYSVATHRLLKKFPDWAIEVHPDCRDSSHRRREEYIACPVNVEYRRYLGDLLSELVIGYPIDGLVFNYTGYGLRQGPLERHPFCFCAACRRRFAADHLANLVAKASEPDGIDLVRQWQTEVSTETLLYLRHRVMKIRRTLRLVCRTQPHWRWLTDEAGPQIHAPYCIDWNGLLGSGALEGIIVDQDDEASSELFSARFATDLAELHQEALVLPSIQVSKPEDIEIPLATVRRYPVSGFVADFTDSLSPMDADLIRDRYLSVPAQLPERSPLLSVAFLLRRVQSNHGDNDLIRDFMQDFLRLIERALRKGTNYRDLEIVLENLDGLQDAIRRGRLGEYEIPESTLRDLSLARRFVRLACLDAKS